MLTFPKQVKQIINKREINNKKLTVNITFTISLILGQSQWSGILPLCTLCWAKQHSSLLCFFVNSFQCLALALSPYIKNRLYAGRQYAKDMSVAHVMVNNVIFVPLSVSWWLCMMNRTLTMEATAPAPAPREPRAPTCSPQSSTPATCPLSSPTRPPARQRSLRPPFDPVSSQIKHLGRGAFSRGKFYFVTFRYVKMLSKTNMQTKEPRQHC